MGTSHIKPCLSRKVGCHLASSQAISAFFDGSQCFWYAVALGRSDDFVHLWLLMFVPPRSENKLELISVSFLSKIAVSQNSSLKWYYGSLVFNFLRISLFWINEKVFLLGHGVFVFSGDNLWGAVSNDEASKTRLLKIFHQDYWIWLLNLSPRRKSLTRTVFWWEQDISNLASQGKLGVALRENQPISAFFDGSQCFWYAVAVGRSDGFVHPWLLMLVPPRSEHNLQLISVCFPKVCCLAEIQFEIMLWIVGFQLFQDFVVLNQWRSLLACKTEFSCFLEIICEVPFQMMKLSNSRLLKTFHQDFWIWLLNLSPRRKSLTRKNCLLMGTRHIKPCLSRKVGCRLAWKSTNLGLLWWLSMFLVRSCCCS